MLSKMQQVLYLVNLIKRQELEVAISRTAICAAYNSINNPMLKDQARIALKQVGIYL